jgi:translation initiation factor 2B subunit (eIF-2B alpha/beta/delta family)
MRPRNGAGKTFSLRASVGTLHDICHPNALNDEGLMTATVIRPNTVAAPTKRISRSSTGARGLDLRRVASDRSTGARGLALAGLEALDRYVSAWLERPPQDLKTDCRAVARELRRTQPAMGPFQQWSLDWEEMARTVPLQAIPQRARRWIATRRRELLEEGGRLARVARRHFPSDARVLTLSRSESVQRSLVGLGPGKRPREVVVLESLPGGEGRAQARDLHRAGLRVRCADDTEGPALARSVDLFLIGADAVYEDGSVVHKVGTRRLARVARRSGVPVVVLTGYSKAVRRHRPLAPLGHRFDRTPASSISGYWTDRGVIPGGHWTSTGRSRRWLYLPASFLEVPGEHS